MSTKKEPESQQSSSPSPPGPEEQGLPEHLKHRVATDRLRCGVSETDADAGYPLIAIAQPASFNNPRPGHIRGPLPGDFLLRSLPDPIRNGKQGIDVLVWYYDKVYKEWTPDRSRVLTVHLRLPVDHSTDPKTGLLWRRNGNMLIQTWRLFLLCENQPFEMPLKGAENAFFRSLTRHFGSHVVDVDEHVHQRRGGLPSYARRYRFSTSLTPRAKAWFELSFTDLGWVTGEEYDRARQLSEELDEKLKQCRKALADSSHPQGA
jgi:hypothetical protein